MRGSNSENSKDLKVLYLTPNFSSFFAALYDGMITSIGKYADLKLYGSGYPDFDKLNFTRDILSVIRHFYGEDKPDVIMMWDAEGSGWTGNFVNLDKIDSLKVLWSVDIHNDAVDHVLKYIREAGIGLILMSYDNGCKTDPGKRFKSLELPVEFYPLSVDPEMFRPMDIPKKYDVALLGNLSTSYYPHRNAFRKLLLDSGLNYHDPERDGRFVREEFARHINECKICVTGSSSYNYPVPKYFEIMSCGALLMADVPMDASLLHFVPGHNFVEVNEGNLLNQVNYYLAHDVEREQIANCARATTLAFHTHEIRARQLISVLKRYV